MRLAVNNWYYKNERIINRLLQTIYTNKLDNLEKIETYNLQRVDHKETENVNRRY